MKTRIRRKDWNKEVSKRMSEKEIKRIRCPKCGAEHDFEIWLRINTDLDPVLGKKVRSGELFRTTCPSCGQNDLLRAGSKGYEGRRSGF